MSDSRVSRSHWDADAARYVTEHADYLDDFYWCPERLRESEAHLLGDVSGQRILELGAGTAPCSEWVAAHGGFAVAQDISAAMLRAGQGAGAHRVQSDAAELPFLSSVFDATFSSFGALPFVADLPQALREIKRVLKPGGRCVLASNHPMAWVFPDDPGPAGLLAQVPYFERAYEEFGEDNPTPPSDDPQVNASARTYAEYHHTVGDWVRAHALAGLQLEDVIEPEWVPGTPPWGQWSELRGSVFPGTAIFISRG
ncbi:class I SAM-dependent methyltransferase [uncultured Corynebacterium sp.]|uniref:class I SAM-dependent methyltransferase n=1 Tax=uncultured Corynebacterium sp. TaxID=159447 RepID=UPI00259488C5|nr:methyltransferase domain-containing protein [uncultured Corynebacterium sp.]